MLSVTFFRLCRRAFLIVIVSNMKLHSDAYIHEGTRRSLRHFSWIIPSLQHWCARGGSNPNVSSFDSPALLHSRCSSSLCALDSGPWCSVGGFVSQPFSRFEMQNRKRDRGEGSTRGVVVSFPAKVKQHRRGDEQDHGQRHAADQDNGRNVTGESRGGGRCHDRPRGDPPQHERHTPRA